MLPHLPETVFWDILKRTDDVKSCVATWSSCKELCEKYHPEKFWEAMSYYHFDIMIKPVHVPSWSIIYWLQYQSVHGCAYCKRPFTKDTITVGNSDTINLKGHEIHVCKRCKNILGDCVIHASLLDPWQVALMRKLKTYRAGSLFDNFYGENQVNKCQSFHLKCVKCIKNIKNIRCPLFQCGTCCQCKYHKSHYAQAAPDDTIMSFNITLLLRPWPKRSMRKNDHTMFVHKR